MSTIKRGTKGIYQESNSTTWPLAPLKGNSCSPGSILHLIRSTVTATNPPKPNHLEQTMQCFSFNRCLKTLPFSQAGKTQNENAQVKPSNTEKLPQIGKMQKIQYKINSVLQSSNHQSLCSKVRLGKHPKCSTLDTAHRGWSEGYKIS